VSLNSKLGGENDAKRDSKTSRVSSSKFLSSSHVFFSFQAETAYTFPGKKREPVKAVKVKDRKRMRKREDYKKREDANRAHFTIFSIFSSTRKEGKEKEDSWDNILFSC